MLGNGIALPPGTAGLQGANSSTPVQVVGLTTATGIALGRARSCAVTTTNQVQCWGSNAFGEFGDGNTLVYSSTPVTSLVSGATAVATGNYHTCALVIGGQVQCWGSGLFGALGNDGTDSPTPIDVNVSGSASMISAHEQSTCAKIGTTGETQCWGSVTFPATGLQTIAGGNNALWVAAGDQSCGIANNGSAGCWPSPDLTMVFTPIPVPWN